MGYDKRGVNFSTSNTFHQLMRVALGMHLAATHCESFGKRYTHWHFIDICGIYSHDRYRSTFATRLNSLSQDIGAICLQPHCLFHLVVDAHQVCPMRFHAYRIDTGIRPPPAGHLFELFHDICSFIVERISMAILSGDAQAFREAINRNHSLSTQQVGTDHSKESYRATSPDRYGITGLNVAIIRASIAGREGI